MKKIISKTSTRRVGFSKLAAASILVAATAFAATAMAQTSGTTSNTASGGYAMMMPGATYIGLNAGQSKFRNSNGFGGFSSENKDTSYGVYLGSYFTPYVGVELGYTDLGKVDRAGGSTEAKAGSAALVGKLPLGPSFNLLGKLGATYSRVEVSALPASGVATGSKSGWGPSYGIGAEYNFTQNVSAVVQYDEYRMPYPGDSKGKVNNTSIGVRFKY